MTPEKPTAPPPENPTEPPPEPPRKPINWTEETLFFFMKCAAGCLILYLLAGLIFSLQSWWGGRA